MEELNRYWPAFGTLRDLWKHEWKDHGKCYLKTYKDNFPSSNMRHMLDKNTKKLTDLEVFHKYFSTTIDKLKHLNIKLPYRNYKSKSDIAKQIRID